MLFDKDVLIHEVYMTKKNQISASEGYIQYIIGTDTNTVMVYTDTILIWTAQLPFSPVGVIRATFRLFSLTFYIKSNFDN